MTLGISKLGSQALNSQREESTPASIWRALAGIPITDELLEWAADFVRPHECHPRAPRGVSVYFID